MHRLPKVCSRVVFAAAFTLAGLILATPSRAAMPTLSAQVQPYVAHAQSVLAITHVRVIDGNGTRAKESQTVLLRDERIAAARDSSWPKAFRLEMAFERAFVKAGGTSLAGLDPTGYGGVIAGYGDQREVELLVEAGFAPEQAIQIATLNGARFMGVDKEIGSIEVGNAADLVLLNGNPTKNIKDIENVSLVFKDGVGYDPAKLVKAANGTVGLR